jgi:surface antigen
MDNCRIGDNTGSYEALEVAPDGKTVGWLADQTQKKSGRQRLLDVTLDRKS